MQQMAWIWIQTPDAAVRAQPLRAVRALPGEPLVRPLDLFKTHNLQAYFLVFLLYSKATVERE